MTNTVEKISRKDFDLIGILDDEENCLLGFDGYDGYICDAVSSMADNYVPIYNHEIWENASDIQEYIEDAIAEGLAPTEGDIDLMRIFMSGYYQYYSRSIYQNMDVMCFNYVIDLVNESLTKMTKEEVAEIDLYEIESEIESATDSYDHNNTYSDLNDIAQDIIDRIEDGEFAS